MEREDKQLNPLPWETHPLRRPVRTEVTLKGTSEEMELITKGLQILIAEVSIRNVIGVEISDRTNVHIKEIHKLLDEIASPNIVERETPPRDELSGALEEFKTKIKERKDTSSAGESNF